MNNIQSGEMNRFISKNLDDQVFLYAKKLVVAKDSWSIHVDPDSCLVSLKDDKDGLPTVKELRQDKLLVKVEGERIIYEGRILFSSGVILTINNKILMLLRDKDAPVDPLKWTSPAGRCDREPFLTALKEFYEEVIFFNRVSGKPVCVEFPANTYSMKTKEIYSATLKRKGFNQPISEWICVNAAFENFHMLKIQNIFTHFGSDHAVNNGRNTFVDKFFPFFDDKNNTLELILLASLTISNATEANLAFMDGEYERTVKLFEKNEFMKMENSSLVNTMIYFKNEMISTKGSIF